MGSITKEVINQIRKEVCREIIIPSSLKEKIKLITQQRSSK